MDVLITILLSISSVAITALLARTVWVLHRYTYRNPASENSGNTPTVSVCVAARNETHALAQCLERILKSDYPKLEILVLDDSSTDDTSLIIKSFAQAGIRFIAGSDLPAGWLGKNHAYHTLIQESSGDYILFLDVDTLIGVTTITQLIAHITNQDKDMISVLPRREDSYRLSAVFGTLRYYWEIILSNSINPPASSALWMIKRDTLEKEGIGLENYKMSVRPERHLARHIQKNLRYRYVIGSRSLAVTYEKRLHSQYETAMRLYYPMVGRSFIGWLLAMVCLVFLMFPLFAIFLLPISQIEQSIWAAALVAIVIGTFGLFTHMAYGAIAWQLRVLCGPLLLLQELILLGMSYWRYLTNTVTWKGRSVTARPSRHDAYTLDE